ncbi:MULTISPECIES: hypothetical protein [Rhizobium]|uniref:Uncharacterized protein n=1 Tax=Rhizobium indicum TaxID=2583231 RepID=A0ABX6PIV2_9HYPH|nr:MULTISPECIES: hypothetical protein [Rhizobium]MBA1347693.1 hypothetical protein [Rhizobium sp. WYCCWR 11146]NYT29205.1 hypothetical protein [Rhizobium sp. WYCCWR 11128]QKK19070.1 hypothetical protein FFM53_022570 [Rhizobium indicum]QKK29716.1 hypothetical protein FE844_009080 [Rhizobium indicum]
MPRAAVEDNERMSLIDRRLGMNITIANITIANPSISRQWWPHQKRSAVILSVSGAPIAPPI